MSSVKYDETTSDLVRLARRNGRRSIVNGFLLSSASFLLPIWQLFYTLQLGMSLTQAMVLMASSWVVTGIMNVPTGIWADKFGRLRLFRIGIVCNVAAYVPMFFTHDYFVLFGFSILAGLAASTLDGSLEANAMDSYEKAGLTKKESTRFGSSQMTASYIGRIGSGIVGAWLYSRHPYAPLLLDIVLLLIVLAQSFMITEVRSERPSTLGNWQFLRATVKLICSKRVLLSFVFVTLCISIGCESLWSAFQQYLSLRHVPTDQFGVAFGMIAVASAFSSWGYRKIHEHITWLQSSFVTMALLMIGLLLSHIAVTGIPYVISVIIGLGFGLLNVTAYDVVQHNVRSQFRSTMMSVRLLVDLSGFALATVLVGRYVDVFGRVTMMRIITVQALALLAIIGFMALCEKTLLMEEDLVKKENI